METEALGPLQTETRGDSPKPGENLTETGAALRRLPAITAFPSPEIRLQCENWEQTRKKMRPARARSEWQASIGASPFR